MRPWIPFSRAGWLRPQSARESPVGLVQMQISRSGFDIGPKVSISRKLPAMLKHPAVTPGDARIRGEDAYTSEPLLGKTASPLDWCFLKNLRWKIGM